MDADKHKVAENQKSRRKREGDISLLREKISKHKNQMIEVKNNEQYKALVHEIDFHEKEIAKIEDEILVEMLESEKLDQQLKLTEKSLAGERIKTQEEVRAAEQRKKLDEEKCAELRAQRATVVAELKPEVYTNYEQLRGAKKGKAVAQVIAETCAACHVRLRPQAFNDVQTNTNLFYCESCGCILYFIPPPPPEPPATAQ